MSNLSNVLWMNNAACKDIDQKFFVAYDAEKIDIAKGYCKECPVKIPCMASYWDVMCVAGGLTKYERLKLVWKRIDDVDDTNWREPAKLLSGKIKSKR